MLLYQLFENCAYNLPFEETGHSVNYAFVEQNKTLYIYFQGSLQPIDWIRNFLFKKYPYKDMKIPYKVHRGFLAAWKEIEDLIIEKITETESGGYKFNHIVVVGYSHGGALAAFCHECVWFHRPDLRGSGLEGYGFEAPRIYGGRKMKEELKERWKHFKVIRTNNDLVTHVPPKCFGFCHVGELLEVTGDTKLVKNILPRCLKSHYPQVVDDALIKYGK